MDNRENGATEKEKQTGKNEWKMKSMIGKLAERKAKKDGHKHRQK